MMASSPTVTSVTTKATHPIVVFGDTTGFTRFAQRTYENPSVVREYLLKTINLYFEYEARTKPKIIKLECDGFIAFHEAPEREKAALAQMILKETEILQGKAMNVIRDLQYPRPDGYRLSVSTGPAWEVEIKLDRPDQCGINDCTLGILRDSYGYSGYLASRMQETHKEIPLKCCQAIFELFEGHEEGFVYEKLPKDKRTPDGIFKEDWENLWSFHSV
jgi:hypothetical protein